MGCKRLERFLTRCFRHYGHFVGGHPLPFFLVPLLATIFLSPAIFLIRNDDDVILLFTPHNAPSRNELKIFNDFSLVQQLTAPNGSRLAGNSNNYSVSLLQTAKNRPRANPWVWISVVHADESNVMTSETWAEFGRLLEIIYHNFTCKVQVTSTYRRNQPIEFKILRYSPDFCDTENPIFQCPALDKQVRTVVKILNHTENRSGVVSKIKLTYPVMYVWNTPVNWGQFVFGVNLNQSTQELISAADLVLKLEFQFDANGNREFEARQCLSQLTDFVYSYKSDKNNLKFYLSSEWFQNDQVASVKNRVLFFIPFTIILVLIFTVISSYNIKAPIMGVLEAVLGILTIGLSLVASFAILFACGVSFNFIVVITPFLALCVGIDNDFLLMSAWRRVEIEQWPPKKRLARALIDAGPSLTITSINDILCFAVGCLSESPAISDFCLFTCVALAFRFLYQLTFFSGVLVFLNEQKWAEDGGALSKLENKLWKHQSKIPDFGRNSKIYTGGIVSRKIPLQCPSPERIVQNFFRKGYSKFISRPLVRMVIVIIFITYLVLAGYGASKMRVNVSLRKIISDDSPLQEFMMLAEKYVLQTQIGNVIVTNAPDFREKSETDRFLEFVSVLETHPDFAPNPRDTTTLWLRNYLEFQSYVSEPGSDFYSYIDDFLSSSPENKRYINDLRFKYSENGRLDLESFRFNTFYQNVSTWEDSVKLMQFWRRVCENYSDYGAVVQDYFFRNTYLDQRLTLAGTTLQTMGIASLMIAFVTSLLMPDAASMFFICFSSLSVDLGVIAALGAWGSDLDPVTMACLLMTIGFSVYYTARMCYSYQRAGVGLTMAHRLSYTLGSIGWPILQGGMGTCIGSIPLVFVQGYITRTFFRTIVLVVLIGLLHGLIFMPVMMSLYDAWVPPFRKYRVKRN